MGGDGGGRRRLTGISAGSDGNGNDSRRRRVDDTHADVKISDGAYGFVRTPIVAWSVVTALSRREEHDGGLACTKFPTVRKL